MDEELNDAEWLRSLAERLLFGHTLTGGRAHSERLNRIADSLSRTPPTADVEAVEAAYLEGWNDEWKLIETAPKDGTVIDLWLRYSDGGGRRIPDGFWSDYGFEHGPSRCDGKPGWAAANMGYYGCDGYADDPDDGDRITHWRLRPEPPLAMRRAALQSKA